MVIYFLSLSFSFVTGDLIVVVSFLLIAHCRISVPQSRIEPGHVAKKAQSANHWTVREFSKRLLLL